jgi:predicted Rossmann fold nucleotide-binding protein DprA/Smf involved in DNA uptake
MPILTDTTKAALLLTGRLVDVDAKPFTASEWAELVTRLGDAQVGAAALFEPGFDAERTLHYDPATAERIAGRLDGSTALAFALEDLMQAGIWTVATGDDDYPDRLLERLGRAAPPVLFGCGPAGLLTSGGVGVVGSRDVSPEGAEFAAAVARAAAAGGYPLVSGGARGVDQISMNAASERGRVVGVLADSLQARIRKAAIRTLVADDRVCLVTPYHPASGFSVGAAMGRNKLIYGLADLTVVVASTVESGGTWAGATEALTKEYGAVAVWRGAGEGPGNAELGARGAVPVKDVDEVLALLAAGPNIAPREDVEQLGMFE